MADANVNPGPITASGDVGDDVITEDILIQRATLSSSGVSRDSKSSTSSDTSSIRRELALSEESIITNAVLVKCFSKQTTSTTTTETDTNEGSVDDEVFDKTDSSQTDELVNTNMEDSTNNNNNSSNNNNNSIPDIKITDVDEPTAELREELKDKLAESPRAQIVPRLDISGMDESPSGCRTPVNSDDEAMSSQKDLDVEQEIGDGVEDMSNERQKLEDGVLARNETESEEPLDWDFNQLVVDIAEAVSASNFEYMKHTLKDLDCITEQDLIELTTPLSYLNHLRRHNLISRDNLSHLQTIVDHIDNPDVRQKAMLYTRHKFEVVFFYPPRTDIVPPYETVKCHVKGRDFTRLKRAELESIRTGFAHNLFVPERFVYIVGIEPGFSVIVTLMLHTRYIGPLEDALADGMSQMLKLGIDAVQIRGKTFRIDNDDDVSVEADSDYNSNAFLSVFHQLQDKNRQLGEKDEEIVRLGQETEFMQLELDTLSAELEILTEHALRESVTLRKQPNRKREHEFRHSRSYSEPDRELAKNLNNNQTAFWDVWVNPTSTSSYDVERSLSYLAGEIGYHDNSTAEGGQADLNVSIADVTKDKDTLMDEIQNILKQLGAKDV